MSARFPGRKLSLVRLIILTGVVMAITAGGATAWGKFQDGTGCRSNSFRFRRLCGRHGHTPVCLRGPGLQGGGERPAVLHRGGPENACTPTWGAAYSLDDAGSALDLDRRVARLQQLGGTVSVSFGGLINDELAISSPTPANSRRPTAPWWTGTTSAAVDLDIEGEALNDVASLDRRAAAVAALQQDRRGNGKDLTVWLTLPADPNGLTTAGSDAVRPDDRRGG